MPGFALQTSCPCGFETTWLTVGADEDGGRYRLVACPACVLLESQHRRRGDDAPPRCSLCGGEGYDIADPAHWQPAAWHAAAEGFDPWLLDDGRGERVRYRCPRCGEFTLECFRGGVYWD